MRHPGCYVRNRAMRYGLSYHAEQLPNPDSRVRLTDSVDRHGLPRLRIDLRFQEADALGVVRTHDLFADWLRGTGLGRLEYRQPARDNVAAVLAQGHHGTHQIGLVRMAARPGDGVVNGDLRCFGFDNLYVAGTAVLPTSGQAGRRSRRWRSPCASPATSPQPRTVKCRPPPPRGPCAVRLDAGTSAPFADRLLQKHEAASGRRRQTDTAPQVVRQPLSRRASPAVREPLGRLPRPPVGWASPEWSIRAGPPTDCAASA
jgi:hypothetical protein